MEARKDARGNPRSIAFYPRRQQLVLITAASVSEGPALTPVSVSLEDKEKYGKVTATVCSIFTSVELSLQLPCVEPPMTGT